MSKEQAKFLAGLCEKLALAYIAYFGHQAWLAKDFGQFLHLVPTFCFLAGVGYYFAGKTSEEKDE